MSLEKIIRIKINELKKEYNKVIKENKTEKYNTQIKNIEKFLNNINGANVLTLEDSFLDEIFGYVFKKDKEKNLEIFKSIRLIMEAKYGNGLQIDLTENQYNYLKFLVDKFSEEKERIEAKIVLYIENYDSNKVDDLELLILQLEELYDNIIDGNNKEPLNENDFKLLYECIIEDTNKDYETKRNLLIEISKYNRNIVNKSVVALDNFVELLQKYDLDYMIDLAKKNEGLIKTKADINSVEDILLFFKEKQWLSKFGKDVLFSVILFGDINFIKERANALEGNSRHKRLFFKTASFWINNMMTRRGKRSKKTDKKSTKNNPYVTAAHEISYEEFLENESYLKKLGFNVSSDSEINIKTLKTSNHKIKENIEYYRLYEILNNNNIEDFPASALAFSSVDDKCDMFIELGLLHGQSNYLKNSPTAINTFTDDVIQLLYKLKREKSLDQYYNLILSTKPGNPVRTVVYKEKMGYPLKTKEDKEKFFNENFIDYTDKLYIPNFDYYEDIILNNISAEIDEEVLNNILIDDLENNYKVNKFSYRFENQIISRYKVLRCITALKKENIEINKESLMFAIVRNSYIDEKTFGLIANSIGYSMGENKTWNI